MPNTKWTLDSQSDVQTTRYPARGATPGGVEYTKTWIYLRVWPQDGTKLAGRVFERTEYRLTDAEGIYKGQLINSMERGI